MSEYEDARRFSQAIIEGGLTVVFTGPRGCDRIGSAKVIRVEGDRIWVEGDDEWKAKLPDGGPYHRTVLDLSGMPTKEQFESER
jgi:hypothetical protein